MSIVVNSKKIFSFVVIPFIFILFSFRPSSVEATPYQPATTTSCEDPENYEKVTRPNWGEGCCPKSMTYRECMCSDAVGKTESYTVGNGDGVACNETSNGSSPGLSIRSDGTTKCTLEVPNMVPVVSNSSCEPKNEVGSTVKIWGSDPRDTIETVGDCGSDCTKDMTVVVTGGENLIVKYCFQVGDQCETIDQGYLQYQCLGSESGQYCSYQECDAEGNPTGPLGWRDEFITCGEQPPNPNPPNPNPGNGSEETGSAPPETMSIEEQCCWGAGGRYEAAVDGGGGVCSVDDYEDFAEMQELRAACIECLGNSGNAWTEIGCVKATTLGIATRAMRIGLGVITALVVIRFIQAGFLISTGDPEKIKEGQGIAVSAVVATGFLGGSVVVLNFVGVDVLGFEELSEFFAT